MISIEKINIYKKYNGDIDAWARVGKKRERAVMSDTDWSLIDEFVQNLEMLKKGLVSKNFEIQAYEKLDELCENEEAIKEIKSIVNI